MKLKLQIKYYCDKCKLKTFGNWIDLSSSETISMQKGDINFIDLGLACRLPKYYQANIVPRSSTFDKYGIIQLNHYGVVDGPDSVTEGYSGNDDRWKFKSYSLATGKIVKGNRIAQFEIRPTMFAPWYIKLKWLFCNGIEIIEVGDLKANNRGGYGTTGK
jgi:dUTP pyrophosphatase